MFLTLRLDHHVGFPVREAVYEPPPVRELHGVGVGVGGPLLGVLAGDVNSDAEKRPGRAVGALSRLKQLTCWLKSWPFFGGWPFFEEEGDSQADPVSDEVAVLDLDVHILDPGASHASERARGAADAFVDSVLSS